MKITNIIGIKDKKEILEWEFFEILEINEK